MFTGAKKSTIASIVRLEQNVYGMKQLPTHQVRNRCARNAKEKNEAYKKIAKKKTNKKMTDATNRETPSSRKLNQKS